MANIWLKIRFPIAIGALVIQHHAEAQATREIFLNFNYQRADSIAVNLPNARYDNPSALASALCQNLETDHEKFRAIYRWIAENIRYNISVTSSDPVEVLRKKKAVCEGYASLLENMCTSAGLECQVIVGFAKSYPSEHIPMNMKVPNHAWNAIRLGGDWHLVDITWSSGEYDLKRRKFKRNFSEDFYLADPNFFILNHYPQNLRWALTANIPTKRQFRKSPIYFPDYDVMKISTPKPMNGKRRRRLKFELQSEHPIEWAALRYDKKDHIEGIVLTRQGNTYYANHKLNKALFGAFYLHLDGQPVLGFVKP